MKKNEIKVICAIVVIGTFLYFIGSKVVDIAYRERVLPSYYIKPEVTMHEGERLPSFNILLSDSITSFNLGDQKVERPFVLFYFGPECPFCKKEMEEILTNIDLLKDIDFFLVTSASFKEMKDFYSSFQLVKYSNIKVGVDYAFFLGRYFNTSSIPFIAIYGGDRRLNAAFIGNVRTKQIIEVSQL